MFGLKKIAREIIQLQGFAIDQVTVNEDVSERLKAKSVVADLLVRYAKENKEYEERIAYLETKVKDEQSYATTREDSVNRTLCDFAERLHKVEARKKPGRKPKQSSAITSVSPFPKELEEKLLKQYQPKPKPVKKDA